MSIHYSVRFASHPEDVRDYDTEKLRDHFLIKDLFKSGEINLIYSHYDRFIIGGVKPGGSEIELDVIPPIKSENFTERRELGVINIGEPGVVSVDGEHYHLGYKEALYIGRGAKNIAFSNEE